MRNILFLRSGLLLERIILPSRLQNRLQIKAKSATSQADFSGVYLI